MNHRKIFALAVSFVLVAGIAIGATFAYLSDVTDTKANTFTAGNVDASLEEITIDKDGNEKPWDDAEDGKNMYPGKEAVKKPILTIEADSAHCYAYFLVEGVDDMTAKGFQITGWDDSTWIPLDHEGDRRDGLYYYNGTVLKSDSDQSLKELFSGVRYMEDQEGMTDQTAVNQINVIACVIQAEGFGVGDTVGGVTLENLDQAVRKAYELAKPEGFKF